MPQLLTRLLSPLLARAERRLPALTRLRPPEALPIKLDRKRIYIVPSGYGMIFAVLLLIMLLGALNYNNNAALLLTCVLASVGMTSMLQTFRALDGLQLLSVRAGYAVAGESIPLDLVFAGATHKHMALQLRVDATERNFSVKDDSEAHVHVPVSTTRRGWMTLPRMRVSSTWPFGWFRAWSWLAPQQRVLVYPAAERDGPAPDSAASAQSAERIEHGDEWSSLRDYRSGDPLRQIAWKASARNDELRVKTFDQARSTQPWQLQWHTLTLKDHEARIARLARWVNEAHEAHASWSLQLPGLAIAEAGGELHYHRCMQALAELP